MVRPCRAPAHCAPAFTDRSPLDVKDARHPLLPDAVPNSLRLDGRSLLVTDSNMAGKTTLVETPGLNVVFAHAPGLWLAATSRH
jgi:DNA mismatch repair ATPase MutS